MSLREQGLNKFVKVTFHQFITIGYLVKLLSNELGIKVNSRRDPEPIIEFMWSPEINQEVVEIRLEQYKHFFSATIEFSGTSDFPIKELV